jgi:FkbM family methyltransferase
MSSRPNEPVLVTVPEFNVLMELSLHSRATDFPLYQYGIYEISGTRFVQSVLTRGMTFLDVGANAGYYSLIAARLVGDTGRVYCFEPVAEPFARLRRNVMLNAFSNITVNQAALSSHTGRSSIYRSALQDNDGLASLHPGAEREELGEETRVVAIDDWIGELGDRRLDLIKVDVEGAEGDVFEGGRRVLSRTTGPTLLFESFDAPPISEMLEAVGYEVRRVHYSLKNGLEFPKVGEPFDDLYSAYEPPNFVALKSGGRLGTFEEISLRSKRGVSRLLRLLSVLA